MAVATRVEMIEANRIKGCICCWNGCGKAYDDEMPKGWQCILMFGDPEPVLEILEIRDWKRDGVLCPEHAEAVQSLLIPLLEVATRPSEGQA